MRRRFSSNFVTFSEYLNFIFSNDFVPWFEHKILLKILFINSQFQKDCSDSIFIFISFKKLLILSSKLPEIGSVIPMKASSSKNMNKFESKMTSFHDLNTKDLETKVLKVQWLMSTFVWRKKNRKIRKIWKKDKILIQKIKNINN